MTSFLADLRLIPRLVRAYPKQSAIVIALLLLAGLAEGIGIGAVMPLLSAVAGEQGGEDNALNGLIYAMFDRVGATPSLTNLALAVCAAMVLKAVLVLLAMRQVGAAVAYVGHSLRDRLLRALMRARWRYFSRQPLGELTSAVTNESMGAGGAFWGAANICTTTLQVLIYLGLALLISWRVTLASILAGAFLLVMLNFLVSVSRRAGAQAVRSYNSLLARLVDGLSGIKAIKAMGAEDRLGPMLSADNEVLFRSQRQLIVSKEALNALQEPIIVVFVALGLLALAQFSPTPFETIVMMALLFQRTVSRVGRVQRGFLQLAASREAYAAVERKIRAAEESRETHAGGAAPKLASAIELRAVAFAHEGKPALHDISLRIPVGRLTALSGPSGSGKTTIADLIVGLYEPDRGAVLVDGEPLAKLDVASWRAEIGYVPQELFLFNDTILNNVTLGDPAVSRADAERALADAGASAFVAGLELGVDAMVGERGSALSGGQRQRIALARALARRPRLLILDEPTTALDPGTEAEICRTLRELAGKVTILAISHQPAIVEIADVVYRVVDGRVADARRAVAAAG